MPTISELDLRVRRLELAFWIVGLVVATIATVFTIIGYSAFAGLQEKLRTAQDDVAQLQRDIAKVNDARQAAIDDYKKNLDAVAKQSVTAEMQGQIGAVKSWTEFIYHEAKVTGVSQFANPFWQKSLIDISHFVEEDKPIPPGS